MEWDKAYNDIFATNKRIANSEAIQKAKNLKPVVNTPASPPQSVPPGFLAKVTQRKWSTLHYLKGEYHYYRFALR